MCRQFAVCSVVWNCLNDVLAIVIMRHFLRWQVVLDCGAVQADALTVDRLASLEKVVNVIIYGTE
jgi:hypothetical protein